MTDYKTKRAAEDADFRASEEAKAALEAAKEKVRAVSPCSGSATALSQQQHAGGPQFA